MDIWWWRRRPRACDRPQLKESPDAEAVLRPRQRRISCDAVCCDVAATDIPGMVALKDKLGGFGFVAPDDPLVAGMVDAMEEAGIAAFGPNAAAAVLEGSKVFSKRADEKIWHPHGGICRFRSAGGGAGLYRAATAIRR